MTSGDDNRPMRVVSWFSCGDASAVATKLVLVKYGTVTVARCVVPEEHPDNDRFAADCERWFGVPILNLSSTEYASCEDVGPVGAICPGLAARSAPWR